ncbi:uncharacterized protein LOC144828051 [Lissotriton helveticus]
MFISPSLLSYLQLKVHQRKAVWRAIAAKVRALGVSNRRHTHCHKRWDDISRLAKQVAEMKLGMVPRTGRVARRTMTPLMARILAVTYPDLDARLKGLQQQDSDDSEDTTAEHDPESGGETSTTAAAEQGETEQSDTDHTSATEGDRSMHEESVAETQSTTSSDGRGDESLLAATGDGDSAAASDYQRPLPSLPSTSSGAGRIRVTKRGRVTFTHGTAAPAPVPPAALSAECVELLRQLCVGQTALLNAFSAHDYKIGQVLAFMEGIHSDVGGLHRTLLSLSGTVTSALQHAPFAAQVPVTSTQSVATSDDSEHLGHTSSKRYNTRSTAQTQSKQSRPQTPSPKKGRDPPICTDKVKSQKSKARRTLCQTSGSHAAEPSPDIDSAMPTEDVWDVMTTPGVNTGTHPPTTSTPEQSTSRQVEGSPVVTSPVIVAKKGSVVAIPGKKGQEGSVVAIPGKKGQEGSVVAIPGKKIQEGSVVAIPEDQIAAILAAPSLLSDTPLLGKTSVREEWEKLSNLKKKQVRIALHGALMSEYYTSGASPASLLVRIEPRIFLDDKKFRLDWSYIANKCTRDWLILIISTAQRLSEDLLKEILDLEESIKRDNTLTNAKDHLSKIQDDISEYKTYMINQKIKGLQRNLQRYTHE